VKVTIQKDQLFSATTFLYGPQRNKSESRLLLKTARCLDKIAVVAKSCIAGRRRRMQAIAIAN
jgi:hypothetical protein